MPSYVYPGPICQIRFWFDINDGTLNRQPSPTPRPIQSAVPRVTNGASPSDFADAATQNRKLMKDLNWSFSGKKQKGFEIYVPLICSLIGISADAGSNEFALALARWQQSHQLAPTGVLNQGTWKKMFEAWQSRRIQHKVEPSPDELITAPPSDFLEKKRSAERRKVEKKAYAAYKKMVAAAEADAALKLDPNKGHLKLTSAYRSEKRQEEIRKSNPNKVGAGVAKGTSAHITGRALDMYVGGVENPNTEDGNRLKQSKSPVYLWLIKNASRYGFYPYFFEPWHWEYNP